ncbi:6,7-dimethyl-8-ribityllumazine synthase [Pseudoprimorskyibacter insulae]|uniref:6,7-dimethyl-8-ribityllumazine synthase n=1 Tax=Pseudoprimorskyibacter insulae TaxID=1695997 RepID=A0A2R8ARE0_9RHOB|nr:6,7-dimethyl-8-ribityllumazine synthase [Pseudoprimorskyibacter insulae]SPF78424.1 6,7-dimethyl-8-ribityllumazine synthase 1 [Pseudoprimorskyibacter insulae]
MAASEEHYTLPRAAFDNPVKILIVVAPYYRAIADQMIEGAKGEIDASGGTWDLIEVPGALEVPTAIGMAERLSNYDGYVALGCVIRGETTHYDTVCNDSSRGITLLGLQGLCIGNGILTVENMDQAQARAEVTGQNKGGGAAAAALHLVALARKWGAPRQGVGFQPARDEYQIAGDNKGNPSA